MMHIVNTVVAKNTAIISILVNKFWKLIIHFPKEYEVSLHGVQMH